MGLSTEKIDCHKGIYSLVRADSLKSVALELLACGVFTFLLISPNFYV